MMHKTKLFILACATVAMSQSNTWADADSPSSSSERLELLLADDLDGDLVTELRNVLNEQRSELMAAGLRPTRDSTDFVPLVTATMKAATDDRLEASVRTEALRNMALMDLSSADPEALSVQISDQLEKVQDHREFKELLMLAAHPLWPVGHERLDLFSLVSESDISSPNVFLSALQADNEAIEEGDHAVARNLESLISANARAIIVTAPDMIQADGPLRRLGELDAFTVFAQLVFALSSRTPESFIMGDGGIDPRVLTTAEALLSEVEVSEQDASRTATSIYAAVQKWPETKPAFARLFEHFLLQHPDTEMVQQTAKWLAMP